MHWALQWISASGFNTKVSLHEEDISVMQRSEFILQIISMWYKTLRVQYLDGSLPWLSATNKPFFFLMISNEKDYEAFFSFWRGPLFFNAKCMICDEGHIFDIFRQKTQWRSALSSVVLTGLIQYHYEVYVSTFYLTKKKHMCQPFTCNKKKKHIINLLHL